LSGVQAHGVRREFVGKVDIAADVRGSGRVAEVSDGSLVGWGRRWMSSRLAPVLVLVLLAPAVAEVLFGATPITDPGSLLIEVAVYGCGALLIRELVRWRGLGWASILALGVSYGIIEEGLALQSLFNPDLFNAGDLGFRSLGVNWVWTQWTLGYHAVWSIAIPILLSELLFPSRRDERWLGRPGLLATGLFYVLGIAALAAVFRLVVAPGFVAPAASLAVAAVVAVGLAVLALRRRSAVIADGWSGTGVGVPSFWVVGVLAFVAAGAWFVPLIDLPHIFRSGFWALLPVLVAAIPAWFVAASVRRWSASGGAWTDLHRLALACGALAVSALYGSFYVTAGDPVDRAGQALTSVVAAILLTLLVRRVRQRDVTPVVTQGPARLKQDDAGVHRG
jgi:hypothetical protein